MVDFLDSSLLLLAKSKEKYPDFVKITKVPRTASAILSKTWGPTNIDTTHNPKRPFCDTSRSGLGASTASYSPQNIPSNVLQERRAESFGKILMSLIRVQDLNCLRKISRMGGFVDGTSSLICRNAENYPSFIFQTQKGGKFLTIWWKLRLGLVFTQQNLKLLRITNSACRRL